MDETNARTAAVHAKLWGAPAKIAPYKLPKTLTMYSVNDACAEWSANIQARRKAEGYGSVKPSELARFFQFGDLAESLDDDPDDKVRARNILAVITHNPRKPIKRALELNGVPGSTASIKSGCWLWTVTFVADGPPRFGAYPIKYK